MKSRIELRLVMADKELSPNKALGLTFLVFPGACFIPFDSPQISGALQEALPMLCLVPAMFIAGLIFGSLAA